MNTTKAITKPCPDRTRSPVGKQTWQKLDKVIHDMARSDSTMNKKKAGKGIRIK